MIPRHQRVLFALLLTGCVLMGAYLLYLRSREGGVRDVTADAPMLAPSTVPERDIRLVLANDSTGGLTAVRESVALPASPNAQARALLVYLLDEYSRPASLHPLQGGPSVSDIFFLPLHKMDTALADEGYTNHAPPQIAVVNLSRSFADQHPSGIEVEMLTIRSIVATLHENLPQVREVRFLVEGHERDTLAGHASLRRAYAASEDSADPIGGSIQ